MTDYLEEVLEEETEDREELRGRRTVVRRDRREMQEMSGEEGEELSFLRSAVSDMSLRGADIVTQDGKMEEKDLSPDFLMGRRTAGLQESGDPSENMQRDTVLNPEDSAERGIEQEPEEAEEEGEAGTIRDFLPGRRSEAFRAYKTARGAEAGASALLTEADVFPGGFDAEKGKRGLPEDAPAGFEMGTPSGGFEAEEDKSSVAEELVEAGRVVRYTGLTEAVSESDGSGALSVWGESGGEGAAGILLRALGRAGRVSRIVRGGSGTAVVTLPGETAPAWEPDVESLDRLVRLDARRYDGGFQLF